MTIEERVTVIVEDAGRHESGVIERLQDEVGRLTGIVAALAQALVDNKILTEEQLDNL